MNQDATGFDQEIDIYTNKSSPSKQEEDNSPVSSKRPENGE